MKPNYLAIPLATAGVRAAVAVVLLAGLAPVALQAAPLLHCQIDQGGSTQVLDVSPVADPYGVVPLDVNGRFRFKAVVIGDARHVDYIKLYVYAALKRQPMLLHEAKYMVPVASRDRAYAALTGINYVYSPSLERELVYGCTLLETTP